MFADWHRLWLVRHGHLVHATWDPLCVIHTPPRPGSRLDRATRGLACARCAGEPLTGGEGRGVLNPEAIGDPAATPVVQVDPALVALLNPCACGGINGFHRAGCGEG